MKKYDALVCSADRDSLEIIMALAGSLPITGILDNDSSVVLYFDEGALDADTVAAIRSWAPAGAVDLRHEQVEEQNWNAEFERSLSPVRISDRLVLTQSWNPVEPRDDELVVVIDPKMSFGTGHHESTRLIARLMLELDLDGRRVLDVGTGTGALAIIAALRGAATTVAFDNNEWAVENARENFERNGVADRIELLDGELSDVPHGDFDVILANLHRNLIIELLPDLVKRFGPREQLLLTSGVLLVDHDGLVDAAARVGLRPVSDARENEWIATVWQRA